MESQKSFLEYGLMDIAFKLKEIEIINLEQYTNLSKLNVGEEDKCRVLFMQLIIGINNRKNIEDIRQFLSSDRRLWQLLIAINNFCMSVIISVYGVSLCYYTFHNNPTLQNMPALKVPRLLSHIAYIYKISC